jgi:hypothetical protein
MHPDFAREAVRHLLVVHPQELADAGVEHHDHVIAASQGMGQRVQRRQPNEFPPFVAEVVPVEHERGDRPAGESPDLLESCLHLLQISANGLRVPRLLLLDPPGPALTAEGIAAFLVHHRLLVAVAGA